MLSRQWARHRRGWDPPAGRSTRWQSFFSLGAFAGGFTKNVITAFWLLLRFDLITLGRRADLPLRETALGGVTAGGAMSRSAHRADQDRGVHASSGQSLSAHGPLMLTVQSTVACLLVRFALAQTDIPARTSQLMAVVMPPGGQPRRASPTSPAASLRQSARRSPDNCWAWPPSASPRRSARRSRSPVTCSCATCSETACRRRRCPEDLAEDMDQPIGTVLDRFRGIGPDALTAGPAQHRRAGMSAAGRIVGR
jgi:hypothetical protein